MVRILFGADPFESGKVFFEGREVTIKSPNEAMKLGMVLVPEDRKLQGLFLTHSIRWNIFFTQLSQAAGGLHLY